MFQSKLQMKSGHQSSINKSAPHQSQTTKTRHKSAGHQTTVPQTSEDQSSTVEAVSQSTTSGTGHQSRAVEAVSQSTRHQTAEPGNREDHPSPKNTSMLQFFNKFLSAQQQTSNVTPEQGRLQPSVGKENSADSNTENTENTDHSEPDLISLDHNSSASRPPERETKVLSTIKSALERTKRKASDVVSVDRRTKSSHLLQPLPDKPHTGSKDAVANTGSKVAMDNTG